MVLPEVLVWREDRHLNLCGEREWHTGRQEVVGDAVEDAGCH